MKKRISILVLLVIFMMSHTYSQNKKTEGIPPPGAIPPSGMPPEGMFPEGMPPPQGFGGPHEKAAIYIKGGLQVPENEYKGDTVFISVAEGASGLSGKAADGVLLKSTDYTATGIVVADGTYKFGGNNDYYTVIPAFNADYVGTTVAPKLDPLSKYNFNSVLLFSLTSDVAGDTFIGSTGIEAANDSNVLYIDNVYLQVDGAQRYVCSTANDATSVINDSWFISTGNADGHSDSISLPFSNEALLISGAARTNMTIGTSHTYYYNSTGVAEGWAALSTDASSGDGLDLYAYNTKAYALNGGYGTYADFTCRVWLYGSYLESAENGCILSKSGQISILDGGSATQDVLGYNTGATTNEGSYVRAGRNAIMLHAPDMMGVGLDAVDCGTLKVVNSTLETTNSLVSDFDYSTYGDDVAAYVDYIKGDVILIKSTSANITLDNATLISSNGVLLHTVLNSDRMGNFLAVNDNKVLDEEGNIIVQPITVAISNMTAVGNILHDDYQRNMELKLVSTNLTGRINQGSYESWIKFWAEKGCNDANWLPDDSWDGINELAVTIDSKSKWIVTETSAMTSLTIEDGALISAPDGKPVILSNDGKETAIKPGNYKGKIVLSVSKN